MSFENSTFFVRRGDDGLINIYVVDTNDKPVNLNAPGTKVVLTYGAGSAPTGPALKTVNETGLFLSGNRIAYRMVPVETLSLKAGRSYWIRCRVTFPDGTPAGYRDTVAEGSFFVKQTSDPSDDA